MEPTHRLRNLRLSRIDRVENPANPGALMLLAKARNAAMAEVESIVKDLARTGVPRELALMKALERVSPAVRDAYVDARKAEDEAPAEAPQPAEEPQPSASQRIAEMARELGISIQQAAEKFAEMVATELEEKAAEGEPRTEAGATIRTARLQKGWSQEELAKRAGASRRSITNWELGWTRPDGLHLHALAKALGSPEGFIAAILKAR
jgi:ribosome-binding protein aMBF1 (putative translation factor)